MSKIEQLFRDTLDTMIKEDEFDKLAKYTNIKTEKKEIEGYKAALEEYGANGLPIFFLIMNAPAPVLKDALSMMTRAGDKDD